MDKVLNLLNESDLPVDNWKIGKLNQKLTEINNAIKIIEDVYSFLNDGNSTNSTSELNPFVLRENLEGKIKDLLFFAYCQSNVGEKQNG